MTRLPGSSRCSDSLFPALTEKFKTGLKLCAALFAGSVLLLGCGSPAPPSATAGTSAFVTPQANQIFKTLPVTVGVTFTGSASLKTTAVTLNGVDVTSYFAGSGTSATATFSQLVYVGDNRLKVTTGSNVSRVNFTYDPTTTAGSSGLQATPQFGVAPTGVSSTTLADVIPIQTRVRMSDGNGNQVWGIQVGATAYPAPDSTKTGFQVLFLKRSDLSLVKNQNFSTLDPDIGVVFYQLVSPNSQGFPCGPLQGCVVIIQSLDQIGPALCANLNPACFIARAIADLGGTQLLESSQVNNPNGIGYTLIANGTAGVPLHPGSFYERIDCNTADGCIQQTTPPSIIAGIAPNGADGVLPNLALTGSTGTTSIPATAHMPAMTVSNNGAMSGSLLLDNHGLYSFSPSAPAIRFQMGADPRSAKPKHVVILDYPSLSGAQFPGGTTEIVGGSAQLPDGISGGLHMVVWDATTFQNYANSTYVVDDTTVCPAPSCTSPDGTTIYPLKQIIADISKFNSRKYIIFIGSIGSLDQDLLDKADSNNNYGHKIFFTRSGMPVTDDSPLGTC